MRFFIGLVLTLALGVMGCGDSDPETCPVPSGTCQYDGDNLVKCDSDQQCDQEAGFVCLLDSGEPALDGAAGFCSKPLGNGGNGGNGGTGGTAGTGGTGGTAGTGGTGGTGGTAGSGGSGGTGGIAGTGGTGSCVELDIAGQPNINGPFSISPSDASPDDFVTVTVGVDGDTEEVTAIFRNANSNIVGGTGFATTSGNETVQVDVLIGTTANPGPHVVDLELRADASNRLDYIFYTPGDGDTYVRIRVENDVPGPETATPCLLLNCNVQF